MQEITISNVNNAQISSETPEMMETTSGSLANQGLWEQMVEIIKFSGPATGIWICGPLMSLIDTAVIGQGSSLELAALGTTILNLNFWYVFWVELQFVDFVLYFKGKSAELDEDGF